ncbi:MAG: M15 family metallopeptidase [Chitinispirillia bacterium]|nr:M15 family metallopeptidase [Chitinispirillia bacterium]MCL2268584.1 M15 family metallopeptidase [Chitinispirillia bacterium]
MNPWQFRFTYMVGLLIAFAYNRGYTLTFGNARTDRSCTVCGGGKRKASSLHFDGLAIDLNLFKDGKYLPATADHRELGEYWESLGGCWGGRFNDGNHYSLAYNGRK